MTLVRSVFCLRENYVILVSDRLKFAQHHIFTKIPLLFPTTPPQILHLPNVGVIDMAEISQLERVEIVSFAVQLRDPHCTKMKF